MNSQRLTQASYADDGKRQIIKLKVAIFNGNIEYIEGVEFIDAVINTKGRDEDAFNAYVSVVEELKKKYVRKENLATAVDSITSIEQCLKRMDDELNKARLKMLENRDEAVAHILQRYLETIQDENEIETIVDRYSRFHTVENCIIIHFQMIAFIS